MKCSQCRRQWLQVTFPDQGATVLAELAQDVAGGLSGRASLPENQGMLFDMKTSDRHPFWMRGVLIPLDIVFINQGRVVYMFAKMPGDPTLAVPASPARFILETNGGWTARRGVSVGSGVVF